MRGFIAFHPTSLQIGTINERLLLFSENLWGKRAPETRSTAVCIRLSKLLRMHFKHDRNLFADILKIIFSIINDYYTETVQTAVVKTGVFVSYQYQSFGDLVRSNPHYYCIILKPLVWNYNTFRK